MEPDDRLAFSRFLPLAKQKMEGTPNMNTQNQSKLFRLAVVAIVAAAYAALTILLAPISYGPIQFRVSEALTALP